ncbi:extracellular solute-binding protein [Bradyrhizobium sp. cir1]|uniref:extracellular solute-binding protein n=1 Tax=Bradyrhizobium sp. cir1 TaxID=1445730 RepID=UPI0039082DA6
MFKNSFGNLEWALIADALAQGRLQGCQYSQGGDRASEKLDTIKKDVVWWTASVQAPQLLAGGQVVMSSARNGRINAANKNSGKNFGIIWEAQL